MCFLFEDCDQVFQSLRNIVHIVFEVTIGTDTVYEKSENAFVKIFYDTIGCFRNLGVEFNDVAVADCVKNKNIKDIPRMIAAANATLSSHPLCAQDGSFGNLLPWGCIICHQLWPKTPLDRASHGHYNNAQSVPEVRARALFLPTFSQTELAFVGWMSCPRCLQCQGKAESHGRATGLLNIAGEKTGTAALWGSAELLLCIHLRMAGVVFLCLFLSFAHMQETWYNHSVCTQASAAVRRV